MEQQLYRACEQTKSKQKHNQATSHSNWPRVLLFNLAHKQWNGIIIGWLYFLIPESIERFLVNNILFDSACSLAMAQIQFSLTKRIKIGLSTPPTALRPITSNFGFTPSLPSKWTSYVYHP